MNKLIICLIILASSFSLCFAGVEFDDVDDSLCLENANQTGLPLANPLSITAWQYPTSVTGTQAIMAYNDRTGGGAGFAFFNVGDESRYTAASIKDYLTTTFTIVLNEWQFTAVSIDSAHDATLYHFRPSTNTWTIETVTHTADMNAPPTTSDLMIGANNNVLSNSCSTLTTFFKGIISDVAIYTTNLSQAQIETIGYSRIKRMPLQISSVSILFLLDDKPDGTAVDGLTFRDIINGKVLTGDNGANNTGLTAKAEEFLTYP